MLWLAGTYARQRKKKQQALNSAKGHKKTAATETAALATSWLPTLLRMLLDVNRADISGGNNLHQGTSQHDGVVG